MRHPGKSNFIPMLAAYKELTSNPTKQISRTDYDIFCKEFVFDKLKGKGFGEAFCEKFGFNNIFLKGFSDETVKYHIEILGYIKK